MSDGARGVDDVGRRLVMRRLQRSKLRMRPVDGSDLGEVYRWSTSPRVASTWMYRGVTPPFDEFVSHLFTSVLAQFVFERSGRAIGIGAIYDANHPAQRASIRILTAPESIGWSTGVDAFVLLANYGFNSFPFTRLFIQTNSIALLQFRGAVSRGLFTEEARLHNFERFGTEWADVIYLSVPRALFQREAPPHVRVILPPVSHS